MIAIALLLLQTATTAPAPMATDNPTPHAESADSTQPAVVAWDRPFREGLLEVRRLAESGAIDEAASIADRLVATNAYAQRVEDLVRAEGWRARLGRGLESIGDRLDLMGPPPEVRAEAQFARGVALTIGVDRANDEEGRATRREEARSAFERARLLAGPGSLRLDATYDQGLLAFGAGEEQRAKLPEISGQQAPPPTLPPTAAPGAKAPEPPDPLQLARAAYLAARERFVERLQLDWRDADTQANVELVQRRLRELDEIEKKREEEKKQEQEQKDQQDKDKQDQDKQDSSQDKDKQKDDSKDQQKPDEPKQQDPEQDPETDEQKQDEPKPDEPKPDEAEDPQDAQKPEPVDPQDQPKMSKEEELQLRERLKRIEEIQQELQERLKRMRKISVEKDW